MLVHAIGNAPSSQLERRPQHTDNPPVMREKVFGLPVDRDILFTDDHNIYRRGIEKRQRKWIVKLAFLKDFLLPGERVLRITSARSPVRWQEQLVTAGFFLGLERSFLVFTTCRMLHIPTASDDRYRQSIAQVRYRDIRRIRLRRQTLRIDYKNGRTERFGAIAWRERRKIRQLLAALPLAKEVLQPVGRRHLCPRCRTVLSERSMRCRRCALAFRSKPMAGLWALLLPGGAYLYARQYYPAMVFFFLEAALMALLATIFAARVPLAADRTLWLAGLALAWAAVKAAGWQHANHFLSQYVPCKAKIGRWSPGMAGGRR